MTPQNERRKTLLISWLVPALLAVITGLIVEGGNNVINSLQSQSTELAGLRRDFNTWQLTLEARVTRLEEAVNRHDVKPKEAK